MGSNNSKKFIASLEEHIANLNRSLKEIKSDIFVNFICINHRGLIITSNKVASLSDISIINNYIKNCNNIDKNNIQDTCLS